MPILPPSNGKMGFHAPGFRTAGETRFGSCGENGRAKDDADIPSYAGDDAGHP
jgi:hypothetical protein